MTDIQPTLQKTYDYVRQWHSGQTYGERRPFLEHLVDVQQEVKALYAELQPAGVSEDELEQVALLHDAIEDTHASEAYLREIGFESHIIMAVSLVTRPEGPTYMEFIDSIALSGNMLAIMVKLADNRVNHRSCLANPDEKPGMHRRYEKSMKKLHAALGSMQAHYSAEARP